MKNGELTDPGLPGKLVSWSLMSLLSINMAISETRVYLENCCKN